MSPTSMLPRFIRQRSFRTQLAVVMALVVAALVLSLTAVLTAMMQVQIERDKGAALSAVGRSVTIALGKNIRDRIQQVQQLVEAQEVWDGGLDSATVQHALQRMKQARPVASWIGVADASGKVVTATDGMLQGRQVEERPWFAAGLKGLYVGDVHQAKLLASLLPPPPDGEPLRFIDIAAPIKPQGRVLGVLGLHADVSSLEVIAAAFLPKNAVERRVEVYVMTRSGEVIYGRDRGAGIDLERLAGDLAALGPFLPSEQARPAVDIAWDDGERYLTTRWMLDDYTPGINLGWLVLVRQPVDIAYAPARQAAHRALIAGLFSALVAVVIGLVLGRQLTVPIERMARAARDVERGIPGAYIPDFDQNRELVLLSDALKSMTLRLEGLVRERTEQLRHANEELRTLGEEQSAMLDNELVGIVRQNMETRTAIWNNRAMERLFGFGPNELLGHESRIFYGDDATYERVGREAKAAFAAGHDYITKVQMNRKDGSPIWLHLQGTPLKERPGEALWMMTDMTTQHRYQEQVEHIAFHDALTGLPNRLLLADRLKQAVANSIRSGRSSALAFLDLDGFKAVNDAHGHETGDQLLKEIARRLMVCVRAGDTVARLGGDEFVLVLGALEDQAQCDLILRRVLEEISRPVALFDGVSVTVGGSLGVAICPRDGTEPEHLLCVADSAMYTAKRTGKGRIYYASLESSGDRSQVVASNDDDGGSARLG